MENETIQGLEDPQVPIVYDLALPHTAREVRQPAPGSHVVINASSGRIHLFEPVTGDFIIEVYNTRVRSDSLIWLGDNRLYRISEYFGDGEGVMKIVGKLGNSQLEKIEFAIYDVVGS